MGLYTLAVVSLVGCAGVEPDASDGVAEQSNALSISMVDLGAGHTVEFKSYAGDRVALIERASVDDGRPDLSVVSQFDPA